MGTWLLAALFAASFSSGLTKVEWTDTKVVVSNPEFRAEYGAEENSLIPLSLKTKNGIELIRTEFGKGGGNLAVTCEENRFSPASLQSVVVKVKVGNAEHSLRVFENVPGVIVSSPTVTDLPPMLPPTCHWSDNWKEMNLIIKSRLCGMFYEFSNQFVKFTASTLIDQTDLRNELVVSREVLAPSMEKVERHLASVLEVADELNGNGTVFVRLAPMPWSRPTSIPDFMTDYGRVKALVVGNGYPIAVLAYEGGRFGRAKALQGFQRAIRPYRSGRDGVLLSNTWGDGNRDSRLNEPFLMKEVEAGGNIGVDVIQIDDGWQKGRTKNSALARQAKDGNKGVWNGYWAADPEFWKPHPERFPNGLKPLVEAAKARGMTFGLWFGPDSTDDVANWEKDADCLISYWKDFGIRYFKIDSLKIGNELGFRRNRAFFDKMLASSNADMVFDLDCTAEVRPGYLGCLDIGPLFVENRYARNFPDPRKYFPHETLRSLWSLAGFVDPSRLRMEFLNPLKKQEMWGDVALAPKNYPADTLFAITMFASPLAWMELSDVQPETVAFWKPLIAKWKIHRNDIHTGTILQAGSKPDGIVWTGLVSAKADFAHILLFRELNSKASFRMSLEDLPFAATKVEVLGGRGTASVADGELVVNVPAKLDFIWAKVAK